MELRLKFRVQMAQGLGVKGLRPPQFMGKQVEKMIEYDFKRFTMRASSKALALSSIVSAGL